MLPGVYIAKKKDGTIYYRASITYSNKHISLGSFSTEEDANRAYHTADKLLHEKGSIEESFYLSRYLAFDKIVCLINFRDNHMYIPNPIYLHKNYILYYLSITNILKFDIDDLFYYSSHRIMKRQGHLYVNDYGMQIRILTRYGIKPYAVHGRDYTFANGDENDMRYENIIVINPYYGVTAITQNGIQKFQAKIHINGNYIIGNYKTAEEAAIAYNKAVDLAHSHGITKEYQENFIDSMSGKEYADQYLKTRISNKYISYLNKMKSTG